MSNEDRKLGGPCERCGLAQASRECYCTESRLVCPYGKDPNMATITRLDFPMSNGNSGDLLDAEDKAFREWVVENRVFSAFVRWDEHEVQQARRVWRARAALAAPLTPPTIKAMDIAWIEHEGNQWYDNTFGFSITLDDDGQYYAAWGEGDSQAFPTLEEAKLWCQSDADRWIAAVARIVRP